MKRSHLLTLRLCFCSLLLSGCASHYTTPAAGVSVGDIADSDIAELFQREPKSPFPARLAIVRVQGAGYTSRTNQGYGSGRYTVVTTRDIEGDADFERIQGLPLVESVAPLGRLLLPANANTLKDLRTPAAKLKADLLLVYSVNTTFNIEGKSLGPLSLISLGFIPNKNASVTSTISSALIDVRSGFIYGTAEATAREQQRATIWSTENAIDGARLKAERAAFISFINEFERFWQKVTKQHS